MKFVSVETIIAVSDEDAAEQSPTRIAAVELVERLQRYISGDVEAVDFLVEHD